MALVLRLAKEMHQPSGIFFIDDADSAREERTAHLSPLPPPDELIAVFLPMAENPLIIWNPLKLSIELTGAI
jgi:hypothetical protein